MTTQDKIIKNKLGLLNLAEELGNVSQACRLFGYSRDSFYRFKELRDEGGEEALRELSRRKPNRKNRVPEAVEAAAVQIAFEFPAYGQVRASNELRKRGIIISPGGMRSVWQRHNLETFKKRLKSLENRIAAEEGLVLTGEQVTALEKAQTEKVARSEIETHHPGYLLSQDTYYVGTIKGVGRIYQQTVIDTFSKNAFAKLYDRKNALVAADTLNDKVVPFYDQHEVPVLRMLTDRGTEYCGRRENHEYQLYLAIEDIDHTKTKAKSPQTNGICERFHRTIQEEFYAVAFRKKIYRSIEALQIDLDHWLNWYNTKRTHSGKKCEGKTPMETFTGAIPLAKAKQLERQHEGMESIFSGHSPSVESGGLTRKNEGLDQQPSIHYLTDDTWQTPAV